VASWRLILAALVSVFTLAVPAAAALPPATFEGPPRGDRVGIATSTVWLPTGEGYQYLRHARAGGIDWIREDFAWSTIEPRKGQFQWWRTDNLMRNAARLGIKVLAIATYSPGWATGHPESDKYPPAYPADFARFVSAVAHRYGARGTLWRSNPRLAPSPLSAIEIWNEPWLGAFWKGAPDPAGYARLVRAAAAAIKAEDPRMTVLASGDAYALGGPASTDWLGPLLRSDPGLWRSRLVDAWTVHLYCGSQSPDDTTSPQRARFDRLLVTKSMGAQAGADKPIWITEFGWSTDPSRADAVSEQVQADYVGRALLLIGNQWRSIVPRSFIYTWAKPSAHDPYNLIRPDGSTRPAWKAIQAAIASGS
jgi:polysaccharide biosynthesis protein PslG